MTEEQQETIESLIAQYPVCQYAFLKPEDLTFPERVRQICESECPRYGTTWACPPGVGTVEECRKECLEYEDVILVTTLAEVEDTAILEETLKTREGHEEVIRSLRKDLKEAGWQVLALSTESCEICPKCAYPDAPCRFPQKKNFLHGSLWHGYLGSLSAESSEILLRTEYDCICSMRTG